MAGTKRGMPFERTGPFPIDDTFVLSKAEMAAVVDAKMPEKYFAVCKDDGKFYLYDKDATPSVETGKFAVVEGGGGGNLPMTQNILWETNDYSTNPATITLSDSITNYDMLYLYGWHFNHKEHICTTVYLHDAWHNNRRLGVSASADAYVWYDWVSNTELAKAGEQNFAFVKVVGVKFGSSLAGTYGRWEKIDEWDLSTFTTKDVVLDLSPYNAVALSSGHEYTQLYNSVIKVVSDWEVGESIYSYTADSGGNFSVYLTKQSDILYTLGKAYSRKRAVLYGYREVAVSDTDVQRIAAQVRPVPDGGATGQALVKASDADGDVEWANVGGAGGLPVRQDLLWNNGATTNPSTIVLSRSMNGYDQILVEGFVYSSNKYHLFSRLFESADMTTDNTIGLSDAADRYVWYNITAQNQLTYRIGAGNLIVYKIYGIKFGDLTNEQIERVAYEISVLPAISAIGRWEKIGEWTGTTDNIALDLSPYQAIALSSTAGTEFRNTAIKLVSEFGENDSLMAHVAPNVHCNLVNKGNGLYRFVNTAVTGGVLYGYRESALAEADVQRIAAEVNPVPAGGMTGQVLTKGSDADFDYSWTDPIVYITDITVESGTGKVTVTASGTVTSYEIKKLVGGAVISGSWSGNEFTPATPADTLNDDWVVKVV